MQYAICNNKIERKCKAKGWRKRMENTGRASQKERVTEGNLIQDHPGTRVL